MSYTTYSQTCNLELVSQTPPATTDDTHSFVVEFINAESCGCNEYTQWDGNSCDDNGSSSVNNNECQKQGWLYFHYYLQN
jgi:hypothetical protein